ncbi:MAG: PAS domain-containing sensor histidine kinase [Pirellulaceae bacterium]|jgi:PAS domain S-box-containing protein|nr:PAS domain-containing sensor histidine kinase [Pirellulaceae bacterium]MCU0979210.1 PAS domain-containing sensor histidine kinase [Pirellulaceae bacterium]
MATPDERTSKPTETSPKRRPSLPKQLQGSAEGFRQIVEHLPIPLALIRRADGVILYTNAALDTLLGMDATKLWNRDGDFLFPKLRDRRHLKDLLKRDGQVSGEEVESRRRDQTKLWLSVWQTLLTCEGTECILTVLVDATKRRAAEDAKDEKLAAIEQVLKLNDRERQLIAYEIHDGFVQQMLSALMQLDAYRWGVQHDKLNAEQKLDDATEALRQGAVEARQLIEQVRPPDLSTAGLVGALRTLTQRASQSGEVSVELSIDQHFPRLTPECELAIYRIVQECLTNVQRHSKSARARVELSDGEQALSVVVQDWGAGFDPDSVGSGHFGLVGVRDRARLIGAQTRIDSSHSGTCVSLILPRDAQVLAPNAAERGAR